MVTNWKFLEKTEKRDSLSGTSGCPTAKQNGKMACKQLFSLLNRYLSKSPAAYGIYLIKTETISIEGSRISQKVRNCQASLKHLS